MLAYVPKIIFKKLKAWPRLIQIGLKKDEDE